ncbi:fused MFS/spermidine synthase [Citricoccus alkalitolerans]|uniref:Spermidine synthase n=1 Tax=Citricoccus alkalitolerans TaxID=246603 RepID=A0ABV8XUM0_9MICC
MAGDRGSKSGKNRAKAGKAGAKAAQGGVKDHRVERGRRRGADEPVIEPGVFPIDAGTAEILRDPFTDGAWLLKLNGAESSQINPETPLDLGFEYMRWMAAVIMHRWEPDAGLRILHLGGAGCTLARWAAVWFPNARQTAVELDAGLAALARARFALPRAPQLRIRVAEAGEVLAGAHEGSRDVIIRDVFAGATPKDQFTPRHLLGVEAARAAARVVGDGIYLVNHGGGPDLTAARQEAATLREAFSTVAALADPQMLKGRRRGNIVFVASNGPLTGGGTRRDALVRHLLSDPLPTRLVEPLDDFTAGSRYCGEPLLGS